MQTEEEFTYANWLQGLRQGRTFITNGPALFLEMDGQQPGGHIDPPRGRSRQVSGQVEWRSFYPLRRIEVVHDGEVIHRQVLDEEMRQREGKWRFDVEVEGDGWIGARAYGEARDSFAQPVYAHTSPVYIGTGLPARKVEESASFFARAIDESSELIHHFGRFTRDEQREEVLHLFEEGRKVYDDLAG